MAEYSEHPFVVGKIEDGLVPLIWPDGTRRFEKLRNARINNARMAKALAEYDARKADVVPIRKGARKDHAATR